MSAIGWALHLARCTHLETDVNSTVLSVNFVMPVGHPTERIFEPGSDSEWQTEAAQNAMGELLFPWKWKTIASWILVGFDDQGNNTVDQRWPVSADPGIEEQVQSALSASLLLSFEREISDNTKQCKFPMSTRPEHALAEHGKSSLAGQGRMSLPHAIAPLTHLPAAVANTCLKMAQFVVISQDVREKIVADQNIAFFALYPKIGLMDGTELLFSGFELKNPDSKLATAKYDPYKENAVSFLQLAISKEELLDTNTNVVENQGLVKTTILSHVRHDFTLEDELRTYLHPLLLFAGTLVVASKSTAELALTPDQLGQLQVQLVNILGAGWDRRIDPADTNHAASYPHMLDFVLGQSEQSATAKWKKQLYEKWNGRSNESDKLMLLELATQLSSKGLSRWEKAINEFLKSASDTSFKSLAVAVSELLDPAVLAEEPRFVAIWMTTVLRSVGGLVDTAEIVKQRSKLIVDSQLWMSELSARLVRWYWMRADSGNGIEWRNLRNIAGHQDKVEKVALHLCGAINIDFVRTAAIDCVKNALTTLPKSYGPAQPARLETGVGEKDSGLKLYLDNVDRADSPKNTELRGFATCLLAGIDSEDKWDSDRAQWITDTYCTLNENNAPVWLTSTDGKVVRMHETFGATQDHGETVASFEYNGRPIVSIPADASGKPVVEDQGKEDPDLDGTSSIDFRWYEDPNNKRLQLPLLGFGLSYKAISVPLDNAGGVYAPTLRINGQFAALQEASDVTFPEAPLAVSFQYLSREKPKALGVSPILRAGGLTAGDWELVYSCSIQSRAHVYLKMQQKIDRDSTNSQTDPPPNQQIPPVALLADPNEKSMSDQARKIVALEYAITSPDADADYISRWLGTEILLAEQGVDTLRTKPFIDFDAKQLIEFRDAEVKKRKNPKDSDSHIPFHPAVTALGIHFEYLVGEGLADLRNDIIIPFDVLQKNAVTGNPELQRSNIQLIVEYANIATPQAVKNESSCLLSMPSGKTVKASFYCLIPESLFTKNLPRIALAIGADGKKFFNGYRAFFSAEKWFETLPAWDTALAKDINNLSLLIKSLEAKLDLSVMEHNSSPPLMPWIMGGHLEQHEWHWTGYAIDFPIKHELKQWIVRHVGVGSYRNSQDCVFDTHLDGADWRLGPEKITATGADMQDFVADLVLPVVRPAKYVAYTMRPRLRFEKWLNGDHSDVLRVQSKVIATGQIVQGVLPKTEGIERLPSPALQWTVPLTMTLGRENAMENGGLPARIANGNMLVLDEALYRTDALARFGGIGERMDIEIVESRFVDFPQKGVNPIFHPIEPLQFSLKVQRPFGLTYDQGANSKIVQTAIVVTPDGAEGKWVMAQVRMRRLIEPDTLVGTELGGKSGTLRFRLVGDDYVPEDFCVEFNAKMPITSMEIGAYKTKLPPVHDSIEDHVVRLLCSWHKARWGGADEPSWRLQVLLQERESKLLNHWKTIGRNSLFDINSENWKQPDAGVLDVAVRCVSTGDDRDFKLKRVALSDYTDPVWLSFIGSFGQAPIGNPEEYKLKIDKDSKVLALYKGNELQKWQLKVPPLEDMDWKSDDNVNPTFQLLRIYRPIADAARGGLDETAGKLITHLKPNKNLPGEFEAWGGENHFDEIMPGDFAYLCSFQRINTNDVHPMPKIDSWDKLVELIFADPEKEECLVRPVPEILGPIEIE